MAVLWRSPVTQVAVIAAGGLVGLASLAPPPRNDARPAPLAVSPRAGAASLALFALLLVGLPAAQGLLHGVWLDRFEGFYRVGSLVFGGLVFLGRPAWLVVVATGALGALREMG